MKKVVYTKKVVDLNPCSDPDITIRVATADHKFAIVKSGKRTPLQYVIKPQVSLDELDKEVRSIFKSDNQMKDCCLQAIESYRLR